jgi:hypothetical protein
MPYSSASPAPDRAHTQARRWQDAHGGHAAAAIVTLDSGFGAVPADQLTIVGDDSRLAACDAAGADVEPSPPRHVVLKRACLL